MQVLLKNDPEQVVESAQCGPFVVVWKSMDEVHYPGKERRTYRFRREPVKGSMIIDEIIRGQLSEARFAKKYATLTPRELMLTLNDSIYAFQMSERLPIDQADELCGVRMVVAKECDDEFQVAHVGDCFAATEGKTGYGKTYNQALAYNKRMYAMIEESWKLAARLLHLNPDRVMQGTAEWNNLRLEMWRQFGPRLQTERRLHINNKESTEGHGVLNGQDGVRNMIVDNSIAKNGLYWLLLGNNGCVPWDMEKDVPGYKLAGEVCNLVSKSRGLAEALDMVIANARWYEGHTKISHAKGGRADAACAIIKP